MQNLFIVKFFSRTLSFWTQRKKSFTHKHRAVTIQ